ncbi:Rv3654c family TadE-like protein [Microbacterium sp.]|uniref:Rv3654c family TadE-like protein n=1 Tax=Microbacterium sp. TaxID=51671 RepID=UPI000B353AEC
MSGSVMAAGVLGGAVVLTLGLVAVGGAAAESQRAAGIADAAALAAADAASGAIVGEPCARAAEVAAAQGASVSSCSLDDLIATVSVSWHYAGVPALAVSRAGPP